jgi:hypothetical protein
MNWKPDPNGAGTKGLPAWDSEDGNYRIVDCRSMRSYKPYRLISFIHETPEGDTKFWDFFTLKDAKDHAEKI